MKRSLTALAIAGEGTLVSIGLVWQHLREIPLRLGDPGQGVVIGLVAAGVLVVVNGFVLLGAPAVRPVRAIRKLYQEMLVPLFSRVDGVDLVVISLAAGIGEELFFRGVLQAELGLVPASVIFGLLHMGGSGTFVFGCWVALMGALLGWLAIWTGGLAAPIVAHAVYDAAAIAYIRRSRSEP